MTNALSKIRGALETWSFKYNCYESVHPWTPFCSHSALDIGLTVFGEAVKLYTPLYLCSQLLLQRRFDPASFKATAQSILRSTTFISANAFFSILFFCLSPYLTGKFYYYAVAYIPGFIASSMAVLIEKPNRRSSLAFYVANVASEALFRIHVDRGNLRPVRHGQVYLFALSIGAIMMLAKRRGFEDDPLSSTIRLVVGAEEAGVRSGGRRRHHKNHQMRSRLSEIEEEEEREIWMDTSSDITSDQPHQQASASQPSSRWQRLSRTLVYLLTVRHRLCPHRDSSCCFSYAAKGAGRALLIGWAAQLGLRLVSQAPQLIREPRSAAQLWWQLATDSGPLRLGLFLSSFSGLYKLGCCLQRHWLNRSDETTCFLAGLCAGPTMLLYPSPTIALYVLWKSLEALFHEAVRQGWIQKRELFIVVLYGLATSQLFYSALMDPRHMKRSYMSFLDRMSHHKLHQVNRSVLDVFGTGASAGYEDFFPDLHPKFMSRAFLGSIWIWMIEQKFPRGQLTVAAASAK